MVSMDMSNESLMEFGGFSLKLHSKNTNTRTKYGKRKYNNYLQARKKMANVIEISEICSQLSARLTIASVNAINHMKMLVCNGTITEMCQF